MPLNLVACITLYKNKLAIGRNNNLLFKLKKDLVFFQAITSTKNQNLHNIVLMGNKTYESLPANSRPLKNRINFILTRNKKLLTKNITKLSLNKLSLDITYFLSLEDFIKIYNRNPQLNVFIIGGSDIYNYFLSENALITPTKLYITHVSNATFNKLDIDTHPTKFMNNFTDKYELIAYSIQLLQDSFKYRILTYKLAKKPTSNEYTYFNLINQIAENGIMRTDRTNTGTISIFGARMKFDISKNIPLMTTRQIPFRAIVEELLWFCRGDTDAKVLAARRVNIWNGNTSREFLDSHNLYSYPEGVLGPSYGHLWRHFGAKYYHEFSDTTKRPDNGSCVGGFDQLNNIIHLLKTDPFSRRILLVAWNPADLNKMALPPCHVTVQFYVEEIKNIKHLSCQFMMRSSDVQLASTYNVTCYSILTYILALKCNMVPKDIIYVAGDAHIYKNHLNQALEQVSRSVRPNPKLYLDPSIKNKDWSKITYEDFELIGYMPHKSIKMDMAV